MSSMHLERGQERALAGEHGPAAEWAMGVLCRLGDRERATRMVQVRSVHMPDWCGRPFPEAIFSLSNGLFPTHATANPGRPGADGRKQLLEEMGLRVSYTCTPHLVGNHPSRGEVVSWGGRAAVSFVNSIMGARSEAETFESALASAITGLTPERGLHLDENREPTIAVLVKESGGQDLTALGYHLARLVPGEVPVILGIRPTFDEAKRLAFSLNSNGTHPLFHLGRGPVPPNGLERIEVEGPFDDLPARDSTPDLIIFGCPHLSEQDINRWSKKMAGRSSSRTEVWFFSSRLCLEKCPIFGAVLRARGQIFVDTCPLAMRDELAGRSIACDSPGLVQCLASAGIEANYLPDADLLDLIADPS